MDEKTKEQERYCIDKIEDKLIDVIVLLSQLSNKVSIVIETIHKLNEIRTVDKKTIESR